MAHVVTLFGWAVLPTTLVACLAQGVGVVIRGSSLNSGCWLGLASGKWSLIGYLLGVAMLAPIAWQLLRAIRSVHRGELHQQPAGLAERQLLPSGAFVWVLRTGELAAYASGLLRPSAVVTTGMLQLLNPDERLAVCEHEAAHVRLGHPRLLVFGAIVVRSYGLLPPVQRAWSGLCRELEAAADDEAARVVGTLPLLTALARVGLAQSGITPAFNEAEHLRYRIRRLQSPRRISRLLNARVSVLTSMSVALLTWSICAALTRNPALFGLVGCALAVGMVGLRPTWTWPSAAPGIHH